MSTRATRTILAVLLALGSHFLAFTKFFYNVAPLYNKFRTVSMALVVLQFTLPMLGFLVLDRIVRQPEAAAFFQKKGWIAAAITGGFCLRVVDKGALLDQKNLPWLKG